MLTIASVPVGLSGEDGRIAVCSIRLGFPDELEATVLQAPANQATIAIYQAALLANRDQMASELAARAAQRTAVAELGMRALGGIPLDRLCAELTESIRETLAVDLCELLELSPDHGAAVVKAAAGLDRATLGHTRVTSGPYSHAGYTLKVNQPVVVADLTGETRFAESPWLREHGLVSGLALLVYGRERPHGVLAVYARGSRTFGEEDVLFLESIANLLGAAVQQERAEARRERLLVRALDERAHAQRSSAAMSDFLAKMSHELRTPLGTLAAYIGVLEMELHGPLTEGQRGNLARMRICEKHLTHLINSLLTFMRVGSGHEVYQLSPVALGPTLREVEPLIRPQVDAKGLRYDECDIAGEICLRADAEKLKQIVLNLISNAVKFTDTGGRVTLTCASDGSWATIGVTDTGRGIAASELERIFDPYVQVDSGRRLMGEGSGLGLAISREHARGMGGDITVESRLGQGSTFTLRLPLEP